MFKNLILKPEKFFIILGLFLGLLFLFINPPLQAPDEDSHLFKMWGILDGSFNFKVLNNQKGHIIPKSLSKMAIQNEPMKNNWNMKINISGYSYLKDIPLDKENKTFHGCVPTGYTIVSYFPAILVLAVLKFFNVNPLYMIYILRFCCLLVYLSLIYNAIKITPSYKWLFVFLALLPSGIYMAGSINTDCLVISIGFLLIAYTLKLKFDTDITKISNKQLLIWSLLYTLLCTMKYLYLPFILLYFLLPKEKFSNSSKYYKVFFIVAFINIIYNIFFILNIIHLGSLGNDFKDKGSDFRLSNIKILLENPIEMFIVFINANIKLWYPLAYTLIAQFSWSSVIIDLTSVITYYLLILFNCFYDNDKNITFNLLDRYIMIMIAFLSFGCIWASIFVLYGVANGMQSRYVLPYVPLIFLSLTWNKINIKNKAFIFLSLIALLYVYFSCYFFLINRFYIFMM